MRTLSTDDELPESWFDDVLRVFRAASRLEDEFDRLRLEVWFVEMFAFATFSALSTLLEDNETC